MAKNDDGWLDKISYPIPDLGKSGICRVFNLIFLLLFISVEVAFSSNTYAQNTVLSISAEKKSIAEVLDVIENKSDFHLHLGSGHQTISSHWLPLRKLLQEIRKPQHH